jgi:U3 small nucleolar RNA-associated protein 14
MALKDLRSKHCTRHPSTHSQLDMPRQAHGRSLTQSGPARPAKRKPRKSRGLNALEIAEQQNPDTVKIPQHRLGESYDDGSEEETRADTDGRSSKRRKIADEQDGDMDSGSDPEGQRWHVGVEDDDEDSDIDSDDAFGASDEDRFADFTFRGSGDKTQKLTRPKVKRHPRESDNESHDDDSDEELADIEDDFGDEGIDLAAAWDQNSDEESEADESKLPKSRKGQAQPTEEDAELSSDDGTDAESDSNESDDEDSASAFSISDDDEGDDTKLQTFVQGLSAPKQANEAPIVATSNKLSAADLMQYTKNPQQRQSLKVLQNSEAKGPEAYRGGIPGRLAPPLAKRQQDRLDRAAAYDQSKKELDKWVDTVKQNRRAEHISFPLPEPDGAPSNNKRLAPLTASKPMTDLEAKINDIMHENGLASNAEQGEQEYEELVEQKLPIEEIQARRAELRKARDLMFREEIRAKRIKKIKSKAYRRVHRKERGKAALEERAQLAAQGLLNSDDEREKNDRRRAEERMGARHKESKWAKGAKAAGRTVWDEDARVGVADMARRDDELRRRIEGKAHGSSDDSEGSDTDEYSSDDADADVRHRLQQLHEPEEEDGSSKLANMAFMKRAEAARKARNDADVRSIRQQLDLDDGSPFDDDSEAEALEHSGRQKFGGNASAAVAKQKPPKPTKGEFDEMLSEDETDEIPDAAVAQNGESKKQLLASDTVVVPRKQSLLGKHAVNNAQIVSKGDYSTAIVSQPKPTKAKLSAPVAAQRLDDQLEQPDDEDEPETLADTIFVGPDDVAKDFKKEKKQTVEDEGDQVVDNSLPGWGSWGGAGISKKKQKQNKDRFSTTIKGVAPEQRKDAKLDRVIINEKRVKKNGKYLASELPYPFESRQQYERAMRLPLGPEWTTKSTFQDATKPRVLVKQGIIKPMARPMI